MRKLLILFIVFSAVGCSAIAQGRPEPRRDNDDRPGWRRNGVYISLGLSVGPHFDDFFDYVNSAYDSTFDNTSDQIKEFGKNININFGYISRFHRNFAIDAGISIYSLNSHGRIMNNNSVIPESGVAHDIEYQVGIFSATFPVLFDFAPQQPAVPYIGLGLSIFSIRLDDTRSNGFITEFYRETDVAVGGHLLAGVDIRIASKFWIDVRGRWHDGTGKVTTLESNLNRADREFKMQQDVAQYSVGVIYYFR